METSNMDKYSFSDNVTSVNHGSPTEMNYNNSTRINNTNLTVDYDLQGFKATLDIIQFYIVVTECSIGLIGNVVSFIVWTYGMKSHKSLCSTYFKFLAASDILAALYRLVREFVINPYIGFDFRSDVWCKIGWFCYCFAPQISAWIIVCLCIERMIRLCFPFRFRTGSSSRRAKIAFLVSLVSLSALNGSDFVILSYNEDKQRCSITEEHLKHEYIYNIVREISYLYVCCVIPFIVITICNTVIIARMCCKRNNVANSRERLSSKLTILTVAIGFLQCISLVPALLYRLDRFNRLTLVSPKNQYAEPCFEFAIHITLYLGNSFNFLLYSFTGKHFRMDCKELFHCLYCQ